MGYDILFQDVDIVWYKDPLTFFENRKDPMYNYDVYFQDDGNHALYYGPYSANTGFYYVRNSDKTRFFFNAMLLSGDLILSTHSHQVALIAQLNEHASMYGLKVKILSRDTDTHPGGCEYSLLLLLEWVGALGLLFFCFDSRKYCLRSCTLFVSLSLCAIDHCKYLLHPRVCETILLTFVCVCVLPIFGRSQPTTVHEGLFCWQGIALYFPHELDSKQGQQAEILYAGMYLLILCCCFAFWRNAHAPVGPPSLYCGMF